MEWLSEITIGLDGLWMDWVTFVAFTDSAGFTDATGFIVGLVGGEGGEEVCEEGGGMNLNLSPRINFVNVKGVISLESKWV